MSICKQSPLFSLARNYNEAFEGDVPFDGSLHPGISKDITNGVLHVIYPSCFCWCIAMETRWMDLEERWKENGKHKDERG